MTSQTEPPPLLEPALRHWIEQQLHGELIAVERIPGGASRQSYFLRLSPGAVAEQVVLRIEGGQGPMSDTLYNLEREAALLGMLENGPVRVPGLLGFSPQFQAMLMTRVAGTVDYGRLQPAERQRDIEAELIDQLAQLHALDIDFQPLCQGEAPRDIGGALRGELDYWRALYHRRMPRPEPLLDFAFDWLYRRVPAPHGRPALVHGDIGPGNFLFDDSGITALIDWELAHLGHPLEDLGALIARTLGTPFGDLRAHIARYAQRSGRPVAPDELAYCVALALTRFCVGIGIAIVHASATTDVPMLVRFRQVNLQALAVLLAQQAGVAPPAPVAAPRTADEAAALFDHAGEAIETLLLPGLGEPFLQYRARGLTGLLRYLRVLATPEAQRWQRESLDELSRLLSCPIEDESAGLALFRTRLETAGVPWRNAALRWLLRRSAQQHALLREALADMYDRTLDFEDPLP